MDRIVDMGKKQTGRLMRVRDKYLPVIDAEAKALVTNPTEFLNMLVREALVARGVWPPKSEGRKTGVHR